MFQAIFMVLLIQIVVYGFLAIIGLISLFNIVNSISMSVSSRTRQYGAMRAIGMDNCQLVRMIAAEAATYAVSGLVILHGLVRILLLSGNFQVKYRHPIGHRPPTAPAG